MKQKNNLKEIARKLDVSIATVSRVINNKPDVNPQTREKVLTYLKHAGYQPRIITSDLRMIGVVEQYDSSTLSEHYFSGILAGIDERVHAGGFHTVLLHADAIEKEIRWPGESKILSRLDGLIWSTPVFSALFKDLIDSHGLPCVVINNLESGVAMPFVESDNLTASQQAVEYVASLGHSKIGFIGGELSFTNFRDRYEGYKKGMGNAGLAVQADWVIDDMSTVSRAGGREAMHRLLGKGDFPTAVLACNDPVALGLYQGAQERGVRISEDLSIVSFDDFPIAPFLTPALTTFLQPLQKIGSAAVDLLLSMLDGTVPVNEPRRLSIGMTLITRDSARPPRNA